MLKNIKITNFRKHTNSEFAFGAGLTALRGANEGGKTTITEAVAYALFGVKAIRTSLEDAVTYGQPAGTLKVVLDLAVDGVEYSVSRGKSGAEVTYAGGIVTGQTESTNFVCRLLKVDAVAASNLMLSAQTAIRGALEAGPKATTELIERLAEFDQIDRLVELMQEKLSLGSSVVWAASIETNQARLDQARAVAEPDFAGLVAAIDVCADAVALSTLQVDKLQDALDQAQSQHAEARASATARATLESAHTRAREKLANASTLKITLETNPVVAVGNVDDRVEALMKSKADHSALAPRLRAYEAVTAVISEPVERTPGTAAAFEASLDAARKGTDDARDRLRQGDVKFATLKAELNNGNCTFCGKDFSDLPEVKEKNARVQAQIDEVSANIAKASADAAEHQAQTQKLKALQTGAKTTLSIAAGYAQYLDIDLGFFPPVLSWKGDVPVEVDAPNYDAHIRDLRLAARAEDDYVAQLRDASRSVVAAAEEVQALAEKLALPTVGDVTTCAEVLNVAKASLVEARQGRDSHAQHLASASAARRDADRDWERAQKAVVEAGESVAVAREALKDLEFNNALLKRVRAARPVIADRLWNLVLATVSSYFSEMRGFKSSVSKTSDGFMVDGHPVATLSGSALDILGLAIRVALVRTFLPSAPFLVLDEPCASMDQARTESLLGFLNAVGFKQILLVTHEDVSESVADHIITLGE